MSPCKILSVPLNRVWTCWLVIIYQSCDLFKAFLNKFSEVFQCHSDFEKPRTLLSIVIHSSGSEDSDKSNGYPFLESIGHTLTKEKALSLTSLPFLILPRAIIRTRKPDWGATYSPWKVNPRVNGWHEIKECIIRIDTLEYKNIFSIRNLRFAAQLMIE